MKRFGLMLLVLWGTAVTAPLVLAHAELISAVPAPGSSVTTLNEIRLQFSEQVATGQVQLLQDFVSVAELPLVADPNDVTVLVTAVPPLPDGVYTVQWAVTSSDGHPISGSYSLGINRNSLEDDKPWYLATWVRIGILLIGFSLAMAVLRSWKAAHAPLTSIPRHSGDDNEL